MKTVIIHHDNCPDGWGSAWWLGKHVGEHEKFPGRYGEAPPLELLRGADVWLVDFCYPANWLAGVIDVARYVTVLDHHQTAAQEIEALVSSHGRHDVMVFATVHDMRDMEELAGGAKANICIDQTHSGVGLVSQYVRRLHGVDAPAFLANIEDRDLWRFELDDTADVFAAVTSVPYTTVAWDELADADIDGVVVAGSAINRYRNQLIEQITASMFGVHLGGWNIPCVSSPYAVGSDVAGRLAEYSGEGIGAYCILHRDHVQLGLRSTNEGPDVAAIAETYGGGGHKHASGLRLTYNQFENARLAAS
jgi:hypothetical protein